ncbi:hypothetical protein [Labrys monachus]|uniref:Uncharacterized protein n=1 Tax=Labrys monachus TaxID=217067 RepID=A0ABU0F6Y2_9HYPH|nr:hypothetical protein [Labrys monachus]MDQ0390320.1 hypothetical protein [Labrys monachus]
MMVLAGWAAGVVGAASGLVSALADTDVRMVVTPGRCVDLRIGNELVGCDQLTTIVTAHSGRIAYALRTAAGSLQFVGYGGMPLDRDKHLLLVANIIDRNTTRDVTGQCIAVLAPDGGTVTRLVCDVTYSDGKIHAEFQSSGAPGEGAL